MQAFGRNQTLCRLGLRTSPQLAKKVLTRRRVMRKQWRKECDRRAFLFSFVIGFGLMFLLQGGAWGQEGNKEKLILSLDQLIDMAVAKSPEIGVSRSETEAARSDLAQVESAYYPQIESIALVGPVSDAKEPVIRDNKIYDPSPETSLSNLGIFGRLDVEVTQPVYTFGKLSNRKEAASRGVSAKELDTVKKKDEIILRVTQLYYALILARGGLQSTQEADEFFREAGRRISRLLDLGSPMVSQSDLYMIDAFRSDTRRSQAQAQSGEKTAYFALKSLIQLRPGEEFDVAEEELKIREKELKGLETYTHIALSERAEFKELKEALQAQEFQVQAFQSDRYPSVFVALKGSLAGAPGRDTLDNPYIPDEFNHAYAGVVAGLKWEFDFGIKKARIDKALAEYRKLLYTKASAEMNIPIQVAKAYQEILEWKEAAKAYSQAAVASRKWLVSAFADFDMGVGTAENMLRAIEKYSHNQSNYIQALFNYNLALAELRYAVGMETL
jgi:outer membrane protein